MSVESGGILIQEMKGKRSTLFHSTVLTESDCSLIGIGSRVLLFGIDLKWNEMQLNPSFDTQDP